MYENKKEKQNSADLSKTDRDNLIGKLNKENFVSQIFFRESVGSTNDLLKERADQAKEGSIAIVKKQKRGKGRLSHCWQSPAGGMWLSILLKPNSSPSNLSSLTVIIGVQLALALGNTLQLPIKIKWPNDLFLAGKKLGGILLESQIQKKQYKWIVAGVGVNVNNEAKDLFYPVNKTAISLKDETGREFDLANLVITAINAIKKAYRDWLKDDSSLLEKKWQRVSYSLGKTILLKEGNKEKKGKVIGLNSSAELIVKIRGNKAYFRSENAQIKEILN